MSRCAGCWRRDGGVLERDAGAVGDEGGEKAARSAITPMDVTRSRLASRPAKLYRYGREVAEFTGADVNKLRMLLMAHGGPPTTIEAASEVRVFGLKARPEVSSGGHRRRRLRAVTTRRRYGKRSCTQKVGGEESCFR